MTDETPHKCDPWFPREVCACGRAHYYCRDCGRQMDECDEETGET